MPVTDHPAWPDYSSALDALVEERDRVNMERSTPAGISPQAETDFRKAMQAYQEAVARID